MSSGRCILQPGGVFVGVDYVCRKICFRRDFAKHVVRDRITAAKGRTGGAQEGSIASTFEVGYCRRARPPSTSLKTLATPLILLLNVGDLGREHSQG